MRLARRSQERQHPVGVRFGERQTIAELIRADNDVPREVCEDAIGARVFFQGHDGVFRLKADHAESARLRALLGEAIRRKDQIWFIAQKPDLALLTRGWTVIWTCSCSLSGNGSFGLRTPFS